jgi:hypothetical protein
LENLRKKWDGFKILNFICGTGKTITYVKHALEKDLYDRIIILSKEWIHGIKKYLAKKKIQSEFVFSKKNGNGKFNKSSII